MRDFFSIPVRQNGQSENQVRPLGWVACDTHTLSHFLSFSFYDALILQVTGSLIHWQNGITETHFQGSERRKEV